MKKDRNHWGIWGCLILGFVLLTTAFTSAAEKKDLEFGADWAFYGVHTPFFVASEKGFFKDKGLNVHMTRGYGSSDAIKRLVGGQADLVFGDAGSTFLARAAGAMNQMVAVMYEQAPYIIYTLKKSGLTRPKDLEGKKIAAAAGDVNKTIFPAFAKAAGIDANKVEWLTVAPAQKTAVFLAEKVDGTTFFVTLDPVMNKVTQKLGGYNKILYADFGLDIYSNGLVASDKFIENNPSSVRGFVRAVIQAYEYTFKHPDEATQILLKSQPHLDKKISRETVDILRDVLVLTPAAKNNGIGFMAKHKMKRTRDVVMSSFGKDPESVKVEDAYTNRFLK